MGFKQGPQASTWRSLGRLGKALRGSQPRLDGRAASAKRFEAREAQARRESRFGKALRGGWPEKRRYAAFNAIYLNARLAGF